jgi:hypothetical protein
MVTILAKREKNDNNSIIVGRRSTAETKLFWLRKGTPIRSGGIGCWLWAVVDEEL